MMSDIGAIPPSDYGNREVGPWNDSGTPKGQGFFGPMNGPNGKPSTELSIDFDADGKKILAPLLVPTLSRQELDHLLSGGKATDVIHQKAMSHAMDRIKSGKSPFAGPGEVVPMPRTDPMKIIRDLGR